MEEIENEVTSTGNSFAQHMLKFDNDTKNELLNSAQYAMLLVVPLTLAIHFIESVMPELDSSKSHFQLLGESLLHIMLLFVSVYMINRLITFIPTYSKKCYDEINFVNVILLVALTTSKIQDKLLELTKRLEKMWNGDEEVQEKKADKSVVKVSQPISGLRQPNPTHQASRADHLNQQQPNLTQNHNDQVMMENGAGNSMYNDNGFGGLVNASAPMLQEPMAANEFGGFSSF